MLKNYIVTDWAWVNCIVDKAPDAMLPWAYAVVDEGKHVKIYRVLRAESMRETEKAVNVKGRVVGFDSRMNMTKAWDWYFWLPKKCIVSADDVAYFDGGESSLVQRYALKIADKRPVIGAWWDRQAVPPKRLKSAIMCYI